MSNVPHDGSLPTYASADQLAALEQQQLVAEQQQHQFAQQQFAQQQFAQQQQQQQPAYAPQPQPQYPPPQMQQRKPAPVKGVNRVTVTVPVAFAFDASNQSLTAVAPLKQPLVAATNKDFGDQVVIEKIEAIKSTSTVPGDMVLRLYGVEGNQKNLLGRGYDMDGNGYTLLVPGGSQGNPTHSYAGKDAELYTRKANEHNEIDFADNIGVDVEQLENGVAPYYGQGGKLKETHVEVLKNRNPSLYTMVSTSGGVSTAIHTGSPDNPGIALSKTEHKALVEQWKKSGGYNRTSRINYKHHTATLTHFGSTSMDNMHSAIGKLPGQTAATKAANAGITDHRVVVELKYTVAVPTKKKDKQ